MDDRIKINLKFQDSKTNQTGYIGVESNAIHVFRKNTSNNKSVTEFHERSEEQRVTEVGNTEQTPYGSKSDDRAPGKKTGIFSAQTIAIRAYLVFPVRALWIQIVL